MRSTDLKQKDDRKHVQRKWFYAGLTVAALSTGLAVSEPTAWAATTAASEQVNDGEDISTTEGSQATDSQDDSPEEVSADDQNSPVAPVETPDAPADADTDDVDDTESADGDDTDPTPAAEPTPKKVVPTAAATPQQPTDAKAPERSSTSADDFSYAANDDGTLTVTGYTGATQRQPDGSAPAGGYATEITIPDSYQGKDVSTVGKNAFSGAVLQAAGLPKLTKVTIGRNVHMIDVDAFADNTLTAVTFSGNWVYIHDEAFKNNQLADVDLTGVVQIWRAAFSNNPLSKLALPETVELVGDEAFANCQIEQLHLDDKLVSVGTAAFASNTIQGALTIPDSLTSIGDEAFNDNQLTGVTLGRQVETIGTAAFAGNQLQGALVIPDEVTGIGERAFDGNQLTALTLGRQVETIGKQAFQSNPLVGQLTVPASVQDIGDLAFVGAHLTGLVFADQSKLNRVGIQAFANNQLTTLVLPDSVTNIETGAFSQNQLVGNLTLPQMLTNLGDMAFFDNQLGHVILNDRLEIIGTAAFENNQLVYLTLPETITLVGESAFAHNQLNFIKIMNDHIVLNQEAFAYNNLQSLDAENKPWTNGENAFNHQESLQIALKQRTATTASGVRATLTEWLAINGDALRELTFLYQGQLLAYDEASDTLTLPAGLPTDRPAKLTVVFTSNGEYTGQFGVDQLTIMLPPLASQPDDQPSKETDSLPGKETDPLPEEIPTVPTPTQPATATQTGDETTAVVPMPSTNWSHDPYTGERMANQIVNQFKQHRNPTPVLTVKQQTAQTEWTWSTIRPIVGRKLVAANGQHLQTDHGRSARAGRVGADVIANPASALPQTNGATTPWRAIGLTLLAGLSWLGAGLHRRHEQ